MVWIKVPPENHPIFHGALPKDPRVVTQPMFGGVAAKVNGNIFAGLFARSTMIWLPEDQRAEALALDGAAPFDPMGDGRARSEKIMLPESMMDEPAELRRWLARAFQAAAALPPKAAKPKKNAAAKPKKAVAKPKRAVAKPKRAVAKPKEAVAKPKRAVAKPKKAAAKPKKAAAKQ